jgi:hypothetical protein
MYLKKMTNRATGRTYLTIARGYRNPKTGVTTSKSVKPLGYLDELEKAYADPLAHFRQVAKEMTAAYNSEKRFADVAADMDEDLPPDTDNRKNFGYIAILKIFHELGLHRFFLNKQRNKGFSYNTSAILQFLIISHLLSPAKRQVFDDRKRYFERFDFSLRDVHDSFAYFAALADETQRYVHEQITQRYRGNREEIYYNVTNYYFEIHEADKIKKKNESKMHRSNPIVQMGLVADAEGFPIAYRFYEGNENDISMLRPTLDALKREYGVRRAIIVADKGINSSDNIHSLKTDKHKDSYVVGFSARGGPKEFREYALNAAGYRRKTNAAFAAESDDGDFYANFRIKSRIYAKATDGDAGEDGGARARLREKQVVFFSKQYAEKAKADRANEVSTAWDLVANPDAYNRATSQGAAKYVRDLAFDKDTGAILTDGGRFPSFDVWRLETDEKYDGYHAVVTNETKKSDEWVINTYRGLRQIENFFARDQSDLNARPAFVARKDHIGAHFLVRFLALAIVRVLQKKLSWQYSAEEIVEGLKRIECCNEQENLYLFLHRNAFTDALGDALDLDFAKKRRRLSEIKKALGEVKKYNESGS